MSTTKTAGDGTDQTLSSSSTLQTRTRDEANHKSSTIRFAPETNTAQQSAKSTRRAVSSSDEATPIKQTDGHPHRNYNTSDATLPLPSPQPLNTTTAVSQQTNSSESTKVEPNPRWYKKVADKYGSVTLENKASVARDHLALERTFLAWLRTSLSFASIGIAITQLFRLNSSMPKSQGARSLSAIDNNPSRSSDVPYSPYLGHAIPVELLPYLQSIVTSLSPSTPTPRLGPTLLDQLLLLGPDGTSVRPTGYSVMDFGGDTANKLRHVGKPLGATFIGVSVVVLLVGFQRYFEAQHWIIHGKFPASRGSISLVAFVAFALIIASLIVIVVISPDSHET